jgi:hypothetical protein
MEVMADTDRKAITLANATWAYLEELSKLGTHGTTAPGVAATLVEMGVTASVLIFRRECSATFAAFLALRRNALRSHALEGRRFGV